MFIPEYFQKYPPQRPPVEPIMAFWTHNVNVALCAYQVRPLAHRHNVMHLQHIFVKHPAAFLTTATVTLPYLVLHAQDLLSVVPVEVIALVSLFHPACCHIDIHRPDTETLIKFHNHNLLIVPILFRSLHFRPYDLCFLTPGRH